MPSTPTSTMKMPLVYPARCVTMKSAGSGKVVARTQQIGSEQSTHSKSLFRCVGGGPPLAKLVVHLAERIGDLLLRLECL
jgi:hypothetical protein